MCMLRSSSDLPGTGSSAASLMVRELCTICIARHSSSPGWRCCTRSAIRRPARKLLTAGPTTAPLLHPIGPQVPDDRHVQQVLDLCVRIGETLGGYHVTAAGRAAEISIASARSGWRWPRSHARAVPHPSERDPALACGPPAARGAAVGSCGRPGQRPRAGGSVSGQQADFVVVANRLPVDLERRDDGSDRLEAQPGRAGHRAGTDAAQPRRRVGGLAGARRRRRGPVRGRRAAAAPGDALRATTSRTTTRASPTTPSGRSTTTWSRRRPTTGTGGRPTSRSTSGSPGPPPRSPRRARRSGCRTTSCSWCPACSASCGRTCGSGSSCTSRSRRRSCSSSCRGASRSSRACSAPTSSASTPPGAPATSARLATRLDRRRRPATRDEVALRRPRRQARRVPHLDRLQLAGRAVPHARGAGAGRRDPRGAGRPASTLLLGVDRLDYTKGIDVRLRAFEELLEDGVVARRRRVDADRHAEPRARRALPAGCAPRSSRPSGGSTASTPASGTSRCTTCTSRCPATSWRRSTWPRTSCWSRRCATG